MTDTKEKVRRETASERLTREIVELRERAKINSWNDFVEALDVPQDMVMAFLTNRPQLLRLAQPRELSKEECATLYKLLAGLMETNAALREHTATVAQLVDKWMEAFRGMTTSAEQINNFANFRSIVEDEEE